MLLVVLIGVCNIFQTLRISESRNLATLKTLFKLSARFRDSEIVIVILVPFMSSTAFKCFLHIYLNIYLSYNSDSFSSQFVLEVGTPQVAYKVYGRVFVVPPRG